MRRVVWARRSVGSSVAWMRSARVSWSGSLAWASRCSAASPWTRARRAFFFSTGSLGRAASSSAPSATKAGASMASSARAGSRVGGFSGASVGASPSAVARRGAVDSSGLADFDSASFDEGAGAWSSGSSGGWTAGGDFRCCVESPSVQDAPHLGRARGGGLMRVGSLDLRSGDPIDLTTPMDDSISCSQGPTARGSRSRASTGTA